MRRFYVNVCRLACIVYVGSLLGFSTPEMVEDVQITVDLFPENGSGTGNPVTLTLKGKTYSANGWFDQMLEAGSAAPDEKVIINSIAKYKKGSLSDIRNLWMPDEQAEIVARFSDPRFNANSQAYFRRLTRARFLCKILYGNYEIFVVQHEIEGHGSDIEKYTIKKVNGKYFFTNKLKNDPVLQHVSAMVVKTLNKKK